MIFAFQSKIFSQRSPTIRFMRRAFFELSSDDEKTVTQHLDSRETFLCADVLTGENASTVQDCEILSVFIHSKLDRSLLTGMPRLKLIATRSTGYDHIDLEYCRER